MSDPTAQVCATRARAEIRTGNADEAPTPVGEGKPNDTGRGTHAEAPGGHAAGQGPMPGLFSGRRCRVSFRVCCAHNT